MTKQIQENIILVKFTKNFNRMQIPVTAWLYNVWAQNGAYLSTGNCEHFNEVHARSLNRQSWVKVNRYPVSMFTQYWHSLWVCGRRYYSINTSVLTFRLHIVHTIQGGDKSSSQSVPPFSCLHFAHTIQWEGGKY